MRIVATLPELAYVLDTFGTLFIVRLTGGTGHVVQYPDIEARSLRNHAAWLRREGREQCADQWETAAIALESLDALSEAA